MQSLWEKHYSPEATSSHQPKVGEVVIVDTEPDHSKWSLGRVVELIRSTDGAVGEVLVNSKGNLSCKTINKLIPLDLKDNQRRDEALDEEKVPEAIIDEAAGVEALPETITRPKWRAPKLLET